MTSEGRRTVLLIDDSPEDRAVYRRYLERDPHHAYDILEAGSAAVGMEICQHSQPDIILLDYLLPDKDGLEVLQLLAQQDGKLSVPVLMMTGHGDELVAAQAIKNGAQDYLVKGSLTAGLLCKTVAYAIEQFQLQQRLIRQQQEQKLVAEMALRIRQSLNLNEILQTTVDEVRQFLQVDRVIIFQFDPGWGGTVAVESVEDEALAIFPLNIHDPCIGSSYVEPFQQGLITAKADIYTAEISPCHVEFLAQFQVRANLVVPILKHGELWGLLAAHHCTSPRAWQETEIDLLRQIASHVSIALQQATLFEQVQTELRERQQAEARLQEKEALLRLFIQFAPAGMAMFDREMCYLMASQQWVDDYNLGSVESLIHRSHYDVFPEIPERWRLIHQRCLAGAIERCEEELWVRADGTQQWIFWEIRPWYKAPDEIGGIVIFFVDITKRKQAEAQLRERERLFITLAEALPVSIFRFDVNNHCLYLNRYWTTMTGRTIESVMGLGWVDSLHPEDRPRLVQAWMEWSQNAQHRGLYQDEGRLLHIDGSDVWYYIQALPEVDARGETVGYIGVFTDITKRKRAEEFLQQSEARLRLAQRASNSGVWDWDMFSNTLIWSPEYYQLYGIDPSTEATYENWLSCIHPEDRDRASQEILRVLNDPSAELRVEFRVVVRDEIRWFTGIGQVLRDEVNNPTRMIGLTIDITQQKQNEIALQELNSELEQRVAERTAELTTANDRLLETLMEQQYTQLILFEQAQLLDLAHDTIMTRDLNSVITFWNQGAERTYGWTKEEALGKESHTLLKTQSSQPLAEIQATLLEQGYWEGELVYFSRDNRPLTVASRWVLQKDEWGRPIKFLEISNDITARKQAEQSLALQAVITRNMAEGICLVKGMDGTIVYANPKFEQMFGYSSGELDGQSVSILNYETETVKAEDVSQSIIQTVLQNSEFSYEVHNVKKDGTPFWCSATCSVFNHPDYGDVLVAVQQDITARKETEATLQQQTRVEQLRWNITQAMRQSLDLYTILKTSVDQVRQILQVDRSAIYRFQPDWSGDFIVESVSEGWVSLVDFERPKIWEDTYLQETQGGRFQNHETFVIADIYTAGLQPCHIDLLEQFQAKAYAVVPIFQQEKLWGLLAIYQNATAREWQSWEVELLQQIALQLSIALQQSQLYSQLQRELQERRQTEAVLREAERRWRSLLDNVQLVVVGLNIHGNIEYANPWFLELTGYQFDEVVGKSWFAQFLPSSQKSSIAQVFQDIVGDTFHPHYQNPILTKAGEERMIAWSNTVLQDGVGQPIGTISIGEDITDRFKVERMKSEFISIVSHELRTPLTSMQAALSLLSGKIIDPNSKEGELTIQVATKGTDRLVRLVNDILDLERLESGKVRLEKRFHCVDELINTAMAQMQEMANQAGIELESTPCDFQVEVDGDRLLQVLTNLLSNAIKFSPRGSMVRLSVEPQGSQQPGESASLLFAVQDEGRGIPADKLESIFDRFQQVDASDSRKKGGTGLGLAICRSIVQQHGGEIWVESILGRGSIFCFTIRMESEEDRKSKL